MFSQKEFIQVSRKFVCVRLETYENEFHEGKVREVLDGVLANSAFTVFDVDGETRITGKGRMPLEGLTGRKRGSMELAVERLEELAASYAQRGNPDEATLQDFHTFRQALNVASGDQRLLLFVVAAPEEIDVLRPELQLLMSDPDVIGRFHLDLGSRGSDRGWGETIEGAEVVPGYFIIQSGTYGITGRVLERLPLAAKKSDLKQALLRHNREFAQSEERKAYAAHVASGLEAGIYFQQLIPYGEDRDGDGLKDNPKAARESARRKAEAKILSTPQG